MMEEQVSRCEVVRQVFRERKFSLVFVLTLISLSFLTFLCEQEIFPGVCAITQVDSYGDRIKIRTSDAGIFVGTKQRIQLSPQTNKNKISSSSSNSDGISEQFNINDVINETLPPPSPPTTSASESEPVESEKSSEKVYYVFKGIPYSQPPEGPLRWKDPQVVDIKSSAQDNTKYKSICSQWSRVEKRVVGSSDCLYINIFTPHIPPPLRRAFLPNPYTVQDIFYQQRHLYPVLIYIHGGDFIQGSGNFYGAEKLLERESVVLVTFNYRLGIFGFLSNGGKEIPGNYGLLDQIHAIKFVHKYIQRFGGNPTRITIFGDVGYLLLSPLAVGLFQGAVWMSDSWNMFSPPGNKSLLQNPRQFFKEIAIAANCPIDDTEDEDQVEVEGKGKNTKKFEMIECLKLKPVDDLVRVQQEVMKFHSFPKRFVPVVDAGLRDFPVMMDNVDILIEMGTLIKVPIIAGVNQIEGFTLLLDFIDKLGGENLRDVDKVKETLKTNLNFVLEEQNEHVYNSMFDAIWKFYFGESEDVGYSKGLTKKLLGLFGDLKSHAGFWILSKKLTRNSKPPAFAYVFSHRVAEFNSYLRQQTQKMTAKNKVTHQDIPPWQDLHYLLNSVNSHDDLHNNSQDYVEVKSMGSSSTELEESQQLNMDEIMVQIMMSFANYGTPKQAVAKFENWTRWHRIEPHSVRYYDLSLHPMSMKTSFRNTEAIFWYETLPQVREMAKELSQIEPFSMTLWILIILAILIIIGLSCVIYFCCLR